MAIDASKPAAQYATFYVGKLFFGIDVHKVQEIIRYQEMTPVPLASPIVRGLINLRGQIITAIDLRRKLNLEDFRDEKEVMNVIVKLPEETVSLLVDRVGDVIEVQPSQFEHTPPTVDAMVKDLTDGVYKLTGQIMLALDIEHATDVSTHGA